MFTFSFHKREGHDKLHTASLMFNYFTCTIDRAIQFQFIFFAIVLAHCCMKNYIRLNE